MNKRRSLVKRWMNEDSERVGRHGPRAATTPEAAQTPWRCRPNRPCLPSAAVLSAARQSRTSGAGKTLLRQAGSSAHPGDTRWRCRPYRSCLPSALVFCLERGERLAVTGEGSILKRGKGLATLIGPAPSSAVTSSAPSACQPSWGCWRAGCRRSRPFSAITPSVIQWFKSLAREDDDQQRVRSSPEQDPSLPDA